MCHDIHVYNIIYDTLPKISGNHDTEAAVARQSGGMEVVTEEQEPDTAADESACKEGKCIDFFPI